MNFEYFKKEISSIKKDKLETEEKEKKEYKEIYEQVIKNLLELIEKLKPYIEYATKEFNLSDDNIKVIKNTTPCVYTAIIRWSKNLDKACFIYDGVDTSLTFSLNDLINNKILFNKYSLLLIKNSFAPNNLDYFVEDLLKKLESDDIYIN